MAIVLRKDFIKTLSESDVPYPLLYVDTINENGIVNEMYNLTMAYIRTNIEEEDSRQYKREDFIAKDYNDIYYNKTDGFWILYDKNNNILSLFKKETHVGYIYNKIYVTKQYEITYKKCPRLVPRVFKKSDKFADFDTELKTRVNQYKNRNHTQ